MKDERTLFDELEPVVAVALPQLERQPGGIQTVVERVRFPSPAPTHLDLLREQVLRDYETLAMDEEQIHPSVAFYVERIKMFRQTIEEMA